MFFQFAPLVLAFFCVGSRGLCLYPAMPLFVAAGSSLPRDFWRPFNRTIAFGFLGEIVFFDYLSESRRALLSSETGFLVKSFFSPFF